MTQFTDWPMFHFWSDSNKYVHNISGVIKKFTSLWHCCIWSFSVCCAVIFTCSLFSPGGITDGERVKALPMWYWRQVWLWRPWAGSTSWAYQGICLQTLHQHRQSCDRDSWHIWMGTPKHEIHSRYANNQWIRVRNLSFVKCLFNKKVKLCFHFLFFISHTNTNNFIGFS